VNIDKNRRAQLRKFRKKLRLNQNELAALAGVSLEVVARYERGKRVSNNTDARIAGAVFGMIAKKYPEKMKQAAQPALDAAEKWERTLERILSVEPGSQLALELEKLNGKSLAELKTQAEMTADFLRSAANMALSWAE
jgi:transcriptional regulator with XRE-family HTH domain